MRPTDNPRSVPNRESAPSQTLCIAVLMDNATLQKESFEIRANAMIHYPDDINYLPRMVAFLKEQGAALRSRYPESPS